MSIRVLGIAVFNFGAIGGEDGVGARVSQWLSDLGKDLHIISGNNGCAKESSLKILSHCPICLKVDI